MGEVIQLQGDQRKDVQEFLVDKKEGLELDLKTIKVHVPIFIDPMQDPNNISGPRFLIDHASATPRLVLLKL